MSGRQWLDSVERELFRRRLPRQEVARIIAELSDHLADVMESRSATGTCPARGMAGSNHLTEEDMRMDASVVESLGSPAEIAETAVREFRRRKNLLSRSPLAVFCTFVLLPVPALCFVWSAVPIVLMLFGEFLNGTTAQPPGTGWQIFLPYVVMYVVLLAPAAGVAAFFGRLARKTLWQWPCGLVACLLVALATGMVAVDVTASESHGKNMVMVGVGLRLGNSSWAASGLCQFLIPLATGVLVLGRQTKLAERAPAT